MPIAWPYTFVDGTVADADQVMANFDAVDDAKADLLSPVFLGLPEFPAGGVKIGADVNLYRSGANVLKTDDDLVTALSLVVFAGAANQIQVGAAGAFPILYFGSALDTNLYRSGANTLKTDDEFLSGSSLTAFSGDPGRIQVGAAGGTPIIYFGNALDVNLYRSGADALKTDDDFYSAVSLSAFAGTAGQIQVGAVGGVPMIYFGNALDTNLYRAAVDALQTDDDFRAVGNLSAKRGLAAQVLAGAYGPASEAGIQFGSAQDTNLYRSAANVLRTDDDFRAGNGWMLAHAGQAQRVISGRVNSAGTILSGTGFTAAKGGVTGVYTLTWSTAFASPPAVMVTGESTSLEAKAAPTTTDATLLLRNAGIAQDDSFGFVAVGA